MLQNEQQEEPQSIPPLPAAQRRVTPEELNAALEALESRRQEQAHQVQQTVAIGEVVQELDLPVTPEEVWQQIQAQRAQKSAPPPPAESKLADMVNETLHAAAQHAHKAAGQAAAAAQSAVAEAMAAESYRRAQGRVKRRGRGGSFAAVIVLACLGWAWFSAGHGLMVNGDQATETYTGYHGSLVVNGDTDQVTLRGDAGTLIVNGDHCRVTVTGTVEHIIVDGDHDTVAWGREAHGQSPSVMNNGDGNHIERLPIAATTPAPGNPQSPQ